MELSAVRQPIYNAKKNKVAFQLSFMNPDKLSNKCIPLSVFRGKFDSKQLNDVLVKAGLEHLSDNKTVIIPFERRTLKSVLGYFFSSRTAGIELSSEEVFDDELLDLLRIGKRNQFFIILDERALHEGKEEFLKCASHIKLDVRNKSSEYIRKKVEKAQAYKTKIIFDQIRSDDEFRKLSAFNNDFFIGDLFAKQDLSEVRTNKLNEGSLLNVFQHVMREDYCYKKLTDILTLDSQLAHKLIAFLNSAMYGRESGIYSIKQAICFIGENNMRKFISLLTAQELTDSRPGDIYFKAAGRARFCELLAKKMGKKRSVIDRAFLSGLFSSLPDILGLDMEEALELLQIHQDIRKALTGKQCDLKQVVDIVLAYEDADWERLNQLSARCKLSVDSVPKLYQQMLEEMQTDTYLMN